MLNTTALTFAGNLAAEPELRFTTTGKAVIEFRVMVNRRTKDTDTGEWSDAEPTVHNCKLWGTPAQNLADSIGCGHRVLVHGHIETETWTDKTTGEKRTKDVINVDEVGTSLARASATPHKPTNNATTQD